MSQRPAGQSRRVGRGFLIVASLALVAAIGQVTLGGVVRITDSGLGCPDWPLCHGRLIPPAEFHTLIEYSHRLSASLLGVLVLAAAVLAWKSHRDDRRLTASMTLGLTLVLIAAVLGGLTVLTELDAWAVLVHLSIAELLIACIVVALTAAWVGYRRVDPASGGDRFDALVAAAVAGTFLIVLSGSYMVGQGYGSSCGTWPLCRGSWLPTDVPYFIHMGHRLVAAVVGAIIVAVFAVAWTRGATRPYVRPMSLIAAALLAAQTGLGAVTVWSSFPLALRAVHLSGATLVWAAVVSVAAFHYVPVVRGHSRVDTEGAAMQRAAGVAT